MSGKTQLSVAEPCHENWAQMTLTEQGRFCQSCQKTVTDFSMMSDKEILISLSRRDAQICGRFTNDQLNRPLIEEQRRKYSWAYIWNFVIATFMTAGYAHAQSKPKPFRKITITNKKPALSKTTLIDSESTTVGVVIIMDPIKFKQVNGVVIDSKSNLPIPFASISIKDSEQGIAADSNGFFSVMRPFGESETVLSVSAIGYSQQAYTIGRSSNQLNLYLDPMADTLKEFVVTAYHAVRKLTTCTYSSTTTGILITTVKMKRSEKAKSLIADWTPDLLKKKEIRLYPNPITPGGTLTLALSLKEAGDYTFEILDVSGRIVYRGQVSVITKDQNISITTSAVWSKGIYWVRVIGKDSKQIYHSKLVLQ